MPTAGRGERAGQARRIRIGALVVVAVVVAIDQLVKHLVVSRFALGERLQIVPSFFELTYLLNRGGVWGIGRELAEGPRTAVFLALPVLITALAAWHAWKLPPWDRLRHVAIAMVVGGAIGNLVDRLRIHPPAVIDFVVLHVRDHYWPAFNVADSSICVGVGILLVTAFLEEEDEHDEGAPEQSRA